jgi:hypothetical protein
MRHNIYKLTRFVAAKIHKLSVPETMVTFKRKFIETYIYYFMFGMKSISVMYLTPREIGAVYKCSSDVTAKKI